MTLASIIAQIPQWADKACVILSGVVLAATVLARIADAIDSVKASAIDPAKVADAKGVVAKAAGYLAQVLHYFPTLGKNPRTQQLEDLVAQLQANQDAAPVGLILTTVEQAVQGPQAQSAASSDQSKTGS